MSNTPWWHFTILPLIDFGLPLLLFLLGFLLIRPFLRACKHPDLPTCAKCNYDMRASSSLTCPECGYSQAPHESLDPRRTGSRLKMAGGLILCLPALYVLLFSLYYYPATYLHNRHSRALLAPIRAIDMNFDPDNHWTLPPLPAPPTWAVATAKAIAHLGGPSEYQILDNPRRRPNGQSFAVVLTQTFINWTFNPNQNYASYLPFKRYQDIEFGQSDNGGRQSADWFPLPPNTFLTSAAAVNLTHISELSYLEIDPAVAVSDEALAQFAHSPAPSSPSGLRLLVKRFVPNPAQAHIWKSVPAIPCLDALTLEAKGLTSPDLLKMLLACPHLLSITVNGDPACPDPALVDFCLNLTNKDKITFCAVPLDVTRLENLRQNQNLSTLSLDMLPGSSFQDDHLAWLASMNHLQTLSIANAPNLTGSFTRGISDKIETLTLANTGFNDAGLAHLRNASKLTWLTLRNSQVTSSGIKSFLEGSVPIRTFSYDKPLDAGLCQAFTQSKSLQTLIITNIDESSFQTLMAADPWLRIRLITPKLHPDTITNIQREKYNQYKPASSTNSSYAQRSVKLIYPGDLTE